MVPVCRPHAVRVREGQSSQPAVSVLSARVRVHTGRNPDPSVSSTTGNVSLRASGLPVGTLRP